MNSAPADKPDPTAPEPAREGWSRERILLLIIAAVGVHLVLIHVFERKKPSEVQPVSKVPQVALTTRADDMVELDDPALFTLPNPRDFTSAIWLQPPQITLPRFRWNEIPRWLPIPDESLGAAFRIYIQTNTFSMQPLAFKIDPPVSQPDFVIDSGLPAHSTLGLSHTLMQRHLMTLPDLPSLPMSKVIAPSRVRVEVDDLGIVVSAVLIGSDSNPDSLEATGHSDIADSNAVVQALSLRFKPASQYTFGEVIFNWHTVPEQTNTVP